MFDEKGEKIGILTFLGRSSVRIDLLDGKVIYIDPYAGNSSDYDKKADLVLVTHQHSDHNKIELVKLKPQGIVISCPINILSGEETEYEGIKIKATYAYNKNHKRDECCGYVINTGGVVIYHSGDTSLIDEMNDLKQDNIDYALLCMDGYYNMDVKEAKEVAKVIEPKWIIPIHSSPNGDYDGKTIDAFDVENKINLTPGQHIPLRRALTAKI